jgi:hypothetical protein
VLDCGSEYLALEWWCRVDPDTVGEYNEHPDKNGKELYEEDILQSPYGICTLKHGNYTEIIQERIHEVGITNNACGWYIEYTTGEQAGWDWQYSPGFFEKIGNIHDNPKLIAEGRS